MNNIIKTPRLEIRQFSPEDGAVLADLLTNESIKKTFMLPDFADGQALQAMVLRFGEFSRNPQRFVRGIYLKDSLIGFVNDVEIDNGCMELGYVIHPRHRGRGYATEMLGAVMAHLLGKGFSVIRTGAFSENTASIRVMEKCGMEKTVQTETISYGGQDHVCVYYEMRNPSL